MGREPFDDGTQLTDAEVLAVVHLFRRLWRPHRQFVCLIARRLLWIIAALAGTTFTSWWHHLLGPLRKSVIPSSSG